MSGHKRLPGNVSARAGGKALGQTRVEYWVSKRPAGAKLLKEPHSSGKTRKGRRCVFQIQRQCSVGHTKLHFTILHSPFTPNTHVRTSDVASGAGYEADSAQCYQVVDRTDHHDFMERKLFVYLEM